VLRWNNERAPIWIRVDRDPPDPPAEAGWVPGTARMPEGFRPAEEERFRDGSWTAQDPSEALVGLLAPETEEGLILDLCAAPGTKTSHLAARYGAARVLAMDRSRSRLHLLRETLERVDRPVDLLLGDAQAVPFRPGEAAGVLVDAPCSALGVLRRRVDARWNVREGDLRRHRARQGRILDEASALPRPGGWLLYSVCSTEPEETTHVRRRFLARHSDYRPGRLPAFVAKELDPAAAREGIVRILPGERGCDGVFAFLVERKETR
ncbi:MAG: methyltransferase domain-containing protein, partial [Candidatus Latescibacteria bacterium]|nr:methyltransferase domain-containing protein [Candidatus Latescibacterota bacterium]